MLYKILSKIIVVFFGGAGPLCPPPPVRAELYALVLAIDVVRRSKEKNFVIFSDSMSSLQSINGFNLDSDLVQKFLKDYTVLAKKWQKHYSLLDSKSCGNPR